MSTEFNGDLIISRDVKPGVHHVTGGFWRRIYHFNDEELKIFLEGGADKKIDMIAAKKAKGEFHAHY